MAMGQLDQAVREMRLAVELDPLSIPCNLGLGWSFYYLRHYDEAIEQYRKIEEIAPNLPMVLYRVGLAYQNQRRYQEALAHFEKANTLSGGEAATVMLLGHLYALLGREEDAHRELARLQEMATQKYVPALYVAFIYTGLNDKDQAFDWYRKALEERSHYMIYLQVEPSLDRLRADPRFQDLLRQVGLDR
jgi:tetratricopeptide (TPR) repeat protein